MLLYSSLSGEDKNGETPLILIHGLFGMGDNLATIARPLAEFFPVYRLDLRNHGRSPRADSMSFPEMAEDILEFMDANNIPCANLLGHSLGGKVAMQLALDCPERVNRLVVADIAPVAYSGNHDEVFAGIEAVDLEATQSRRDAEDVLRRYIDEDGVRLFLLKSLYRNDSGRFDWRLNVAAIKQCYEQLRAANQADGVFEGQTLFIKGEDSAYIQTSHGDTIKRLFPHASLKIIQGTGHWLHAEKPTVFNKLVEKFLLPSSPT